MSLDVSLYGVEQCPNCAHPIGTRHELFDANITHNLTAMADAAGIYVALWRPEELMDPAAAAVLRDAVAEKRWAEVDAIREQLPKVYARDLIEPLTTGLAVLRKEPARFAVHAPANGWGTYSGLVNFVDEYLAACVANPTAEVRVSR